MRVIGEIRTPTVLLSREESSIDHLFVVAVQRFLHGTENSLACLIRHV